MYQSMKVKIEGVAPLLMKNGHTADPLNTFAQQMKEITKLRNKTDEHHRRLSEIEWHGALYLNPDGQIVIPGENIERMLQEAAKKSRLGREFTSGVICDGSWALKYDGPADPKALFKDKKFVDRRGAGVQKSRVMRTRPVFNVWSLAFEVQYLPQVVNEDSVRKAIATAGQIIGLGDYRPRFGRFVVAA
jgi:hypothetical protein